MDALYILALDRRSRLSWCIAGFNQSSGGDFASVFTLGSVPKSMAARGKNLLLENLPSVIESLVESFVERLAEALMESLAEVTQTSAVFTTGFAGPQSRKGAQQQKRRQQHRSPQCSAYISNWPKVQARNF
jgi:hypothetical protein